MPKKIESLTAEQIARFPEWCEKWIADGLSTARTDYAVVEQSVLGCYRIAKLQRPLVLLRLGSPFGVTLGGALAIGLLKKFPVWSQVRSQVESQVRSQVRSQVWSQVRSQVESQVESQVWLQVRSQVESQVRSQVGSVFSNYFGGQFWASWYSWVSFFRDVCGWSDPILDAYTLGEGLHEAGWVWWHESVCAISDRPHTLLKNTHGLHCPNGPALAYTDGWEIYALNGVRVPQDLVMTKADDLDVTRWCTTKETNAEIRREAVRKIGIERVCTALKAKTIDRHGDYELIVFDIGDGRQRPHLKMKNPSIGVYHIEGVAPEIKTVQQAINWRAGNEKRDWQPEILT